MHAADRVANTTAGPGSTRRRRRTASRWSARCSTPARTHRAGDDHQLDAIGWATVWRPEDDILRAAGAVEPSALPLADFHDGAAKAGARVRRRVPAIAAPDIARTRD